MYNKTIIRFDFCDIQNNGGRGKGRCRLRLIRALTSTLVIPDITKTPSNNCLLRTVPPFVTAHTFSASQIRVLIQRYFCAVDDYVEKADLSKG